MRNGVDQRRNVIGGEGPTPHLYNIPLARIERFRKQVTLIDLIAENKTNAATNLEQVKRLFRVLTRSPL